MCPSPIAVVLVSGGMDSCVSAAEARAAGFDLAFLHGTYGQRTEDRELACFEALAGHFGIPQGRCLVVDLAYLGRIGGSSLTDPAIPVEASPLRPRSKSAAASRGERLAAGAGPDRAGSPTGSSDRPMRALDASAGPSAIPSSYVPFRNAHFLAAAVSWAEVIGATAIYIGAVEEDSSGYPDCREEYFRAFQRLLELGTRPETALRIVTPVLHLDKAGIVRRGLELNAPFDLTWSCYSKSDAACGICDSCARRLRGFAGAGAVDPIPYAAV